MIIREDNNGIHCSGSIIAPKLILTAGHCFAENSDNYIPKDKLRIVFGMHDLTDLDRSFIPKTIRKIKEVKVHPDYKWPKAYFDIVILKLYKRVVFSENIYPVCLPNVENADRNHLKRDSVTVVGFGPVDENSKTMRQISQRIRSYNYCDTRYKAENADIRLRSLLLRTLPDGFNDALICAQNQ